MVGVFQALTSHWFVWISPFSAKMQICLVSEFAPYGNIKVDDLELAALLEQLHLLYPHINPLSHIRTVVENATAQCYANIGNVNS